MPRNTQSSFTFFRSLVDSLASVYSRSQKNFCLLESQQLDHSSSNISWFAAEPEIEIEARGDLITERKGEVHDRYRENPWDALQKIRAKNPGWYFGYLGYDLKNFTENLSSSNRSLSDAPDLYFFKPGVLFSYNHQTNRLDAIKGSLPQKPGTRSSAGIVEIEPLRCITKKREYVEKIREAQRQISEGDYYEINLSHPLTANMRGEPYELYRRMRKTGPVPFGAFLQVGNTSVCCASPERFLNKTGEIVRSQPIKGTAARDPDPARDRRLKQNLLQSEKDRAENLMIVDLVRHDLSRIAKTGTVRVPRLFELQSFRTVHQLISTVEAEIIQGTDLVEILKSCFPMGSMTGAPKISAMQAIEKLEDYRRGIYSGAIGYLSPGHDFDFNVVIRTAITDGADLIYPVGGAVTSDSDPEDEWEETLVKARAITNIFSGLQSDDVK